MKTVNVNGVDLKVLDRGSGTPLVFVHGFPLDHTLWRSQIEFFSERVRVIAPDLRGFGLSDATSGTVTMEQYADDLNAMLDALAVHDQIVFCGLSMGGYVGWQFWRKYARRVRAMIVCNTRAVADTVEAAEGRLKLAARVLKEGSGVAAEAMLPKFFAPQRDPELVEFVQQMVLRQKPEGIAAALHGMAVRSPATELLPTIDVPTLVIGGQHDSIATVEEMEKIADEIPESAWFVVPNAGHLTPLENPKVFNDALLEFFVPPLFGVFPEPI